MRIEQLQTLRVDRYLFVQITTDTGRVGLGEAGMWAYVGAKAAVIEDWTLQITNHHPILAVQEWQQLLPDAVDVVIDMQSLDLVAPATVALLELGARPLLAEKLMLDQC